jgi:AraC-like DNA-binding protein
MMPRSFVFLNDSFPLGVKRITSQTENNFHLHEDYAELVIIGRGYASHLVGQREYPVGPGDVFVIKDGRSHAYAKVRDIELINILFDWKQLNLPLHDLAACPGFQVLFRIDPLSQAKDRFDSRLRLDSEQLLYLVNLTRRLEATLAAAAPGYRFAALNLFGQMVEYLVNAYAALDSKTIKESMSHLLGDLAGGMERHYAAPLTVEEMCRRTNMSRASLFRHFRKYYGDTPLKHLLGIRLRHATQLLLSGKLGISEIALKTGFTDGAYFSYLFRRETGCTPNAYRKRQLPGR